jgi:hypothetical protein
MRPENQENGSAKIPETGDHHLLFSTNQIFIQIGIAPLGYAYTRVRASGKRKNP